MVERCGSPTYDEPAVSPCSRPDLTSRCPFVLPCAKSLWFCETQHRNLAALRRAAPDPLVELHPDAAAARGIAGGDWVRIETPLGSVRARAKLNAGSTRASRAGSTAGGRAAPSWACRATRPAPRRAPTST